VTDAAALGVPVAEISAILKDSGFKDSDIRMIYAGSSPKLLLNPRLAKSIMEANPDEYLDRINAVANAVDSL
jgi:hypothetical protein